MGHVGHWQEFQQVDIDVKRPGDGMNAPIEPMILVPARANSNAQATIDIDGISCR